MKLISLRLFFLFIAGIIFLAPSYAQLTSASSLSVYGIGELESKGTAYQQSMGNLRATLFGPYLLNPTNPATYSIIASPTFNIEVSGHFVKQKQNSNSIASNSTIFKSATLAFPIHKRWCSVVGIAPKSKVGYNFQTKQQHADLGEIITSYTGSGGITDLFWGNSFLILREKKLTKKYYIDSTNTQSRDTTITNHRSLSFGFNVSYLFGSIDKTKIIEPTSGFNIQSKERIRINGYTAETGIHYYKKLHQDIAISAGITYSLGNKIQGNYSRLIRTYTGVIPYEDAKDTLFADTIKTTVLTLPQSVNAGIAFLIGDSWLVGAEYSYTHWPSFTLYKDANLFKPKQEISLGTQFIPENKVFGNYLKQIRYRLGARYALSQIEINNEQLTEYGISFGFGLPIGRNPKTSFFNIGYEIGRRGLSGSSQYFENFNFLFIGLVLTPARYDKWFEKQKID